MRISYGAGVVVLVLVPFVLLLIRALDVSETLFLVFILFGAWTIAESLMFSDPFERTRYLVSGIILGFAAPFFIVPLNYGVALIIVGIIIGVLIVGLRRKA